MPDAEVKYMPVDAQESGFSGGGLWRIFHAIRFLGDFFAGVGVLVCLQLACAVIVDPRGDFNTGVFPVIVRDARQIKMRLFRSKNVYKSAGGIVLGSSRAMKLSPMDLEKAFGYKFFNFSVDSARAEDFLAIYRWARSLGAKPRLIVIGLDLDALHDTVGPDSRLAQNKELNEALTGKPASQKLIKFHTYKSSLTIAFMKDLAFSLKQFVLPAKVFSHYEDDGYLRYDEWERLRTAGKFNPHDRDDVCLNEYIYRFQDMKGLSPARKLQLEEVITEAHADGAEVIVWLTPLPPDTSAVLEAKTGYKVLLRDARVYLAELSGRLKVRVYDYSTIDAYHGTSAGWYDCGHTDEKDSSLIVSALAAGRR